MERAAAEMTMERARKGVDAVQAVAAVFELKAVVDQGDGAGKEEGSQGEGQIQGCWCGGEECCQAESKGGDDV